MSNISRAHIWPEPVPIETMEDGTSRQDIHPIRISRSK